MELLKKSVYDLHTRFLPMTHLCPFLVYKMFAAVAYAHMGLFYLDLYNVCLLG